MITLVDGSVVEAGAESFAAPKCFYKRDDIKSVVIPEGVKTVRKESFFGCTSLESVTIPYGVTTIEPSAFEGCARLRAVLLPESLKVLSEHAFSGTGLESVELTARLKTVGKLVFDKCPNLERLVVPEGYKATSIGVYADRIREIVMPGGMEHLLVNAPRSSWYYRLNCKDMSELQGYLGPDGRYAQPVCLYSSYFERIYGPFFTAGEAYEAIRGDIAEFACSIEPDDSDLLAANIAVDFLHDTCLDSYDVRYDGMRSGAIEYHALPGYTAGDMLYIVEVEMHHSASFHPWTELCGLFTVENDAICAADAIHPGFVYPISTRFATIRSLVPDGNVIELSDGEYLYGYSSDDVDERMSSMNEW